jgi:DNA modification methylase
MKVKMVAIEDVVPYARNPRKNMAAISKVSASLKEFGWQQPIVVDKEMVVIAGHTRLEAARTLDMKKVPVQIADKLTDAQVKAYRIADNRVSQEAEWDIDLLKLELSDLDGLDYDLLLTGFDDDELNGMLIEAVEEGLTDEDEVPPPSEQPVSVLGDVWVLGKNTVICGDATNLDHWDKLNIADDCVVFTSPPYNLGASVKLSGNKNFNSKSSPYTDYSDDFSSDDYAELIESALACGFSHCSVVALNLQPLSGSKRPLMKFLSDYRSNLIDIITWDKGHAAPQIQKGIMASRYEWIFLLSDKDNASRSIPYASWQGKFSNVHQSPPQRNNEYSKIHAATFPVHLPEFVIGDLIDQCKGVVDCFCGTGTTIIAAEKTGKAGYGIEINPQYVDVIVNRWQDFTGKEAVHAETGKTYNEMKAERDGGE